MADIGRNDALAKRALATLLYGIVFITTAQLHSSKPELRFCAGSNPDRDLNGDLRW